MQRQLPIVPAYAFTDFKSQGQMIEHTIVDIRKTSSFSLSPFNAYVALSCAHGQDSTCLLWDFENDLFTCHPCEHLRQEEQWLLNAAKNTYLRYEEGYYGPKL